MNLEAHSYDLDALALARGLVRGQRGTLTMHLAHAAGGSPPADSGDLVIVSRTGALRDGDIVVASANGGANALQRYSRRSGVAPLDRVDAVGAERSPISCAEQHIEGRVIVVVRLLAHA